jgi:probable rRNA maturation factor
MIDTVSVPAIPVAAEERDGSDDDPGPSSLSLIVECEGWRALGDVEVVVLRAYIACAATVGAIADREVSILLSSEEAVAALNGRYRGKPQPTNVLSFPAAVFSPTAAESPLGDIIIAYETVLREADEESKPPLDHLSHLVVHGLLHLAGFDHQSDDEAERMERLEREILERIGVPDPYSNATPANG